MKLIDDTGLYNNMHNSNLIGKIREASFETSPYGSQSLSLTADIYPDTVKKILKGETSFENAFSIVPDDYNFLFATYNPAIKKVIFNPPATIVLWRDGTKTVVKCKEGDQFDKWAGLSLCISKKIFGARFHKVFKEWCDKEEKQEQQKQPHKKDILRFGNCTEIDAEELPKMAETIQENFSEIIKMAELGDMDIEASGFFTGTCFENMLDDIILIR